MISDLVYRILFQMIQEQFKVSEVEVCRPRCVLGVELPGQGL